MLIWICIFNNSSTCKQYYNCPICVDYRKMKSAKHKICNLWSTFPYYDYNRNNSKPLDITYKYAMLSIKLTPYHNFYCFTSKKENFSSTLLTSNLYKNYCQSIIIKKGCLFASIIQITYKFLYWNYNHWYSRQNSFFEGRLTWYLFKIYISSVLSCSYRMCRHCVLNENLLLFYENTNFVVMFMMIFSVNFTSKPFG